MGRPPRRLVFAPPVRLVVVKREHSVPGADHLWVSLVVANEVKGLELHGRQQQANREKRAARDQLGFRTHAELPIPVRDLHQGHRQRSV